MIDKNAPSPLTKAPSARDASCLVITPKDVDRDTRPIAAEIPVSITYNGLAHAVMMATPQDLEDFLVGFSLSEGIITSTSEIEAIDIRPVENGFLASVRVPQERFSAVVAGRRNVVGQSGCGICGIIEIENIIRPFPPLPVPKKVSPQIIFSALNNLRSHQPLNQATGAVHAAAFVSWLGQILACREDIGRHNALDKLIGYLARNQISMAHGFVLISSRCSFELVQKTALAACPMLVTVSAPTTFALQLAEQAGLTLVALARSDSVLCFNDPHHIFTEQG